MSWPNSLGIAWLPGEVGSRRVVPLINGGASVWPKLRAEGGSPGYKKSSADTVGLRRARLRRGEEAPKNVASETDELRPRRCKPQAERDSSKWAKLWVEGGKPGCKKSRVEGLKPNLAMLRVGTKGPGADMSGEEGGRSRRDSLKAKEEEPRRAMLCRDVKAPEWRKSRAERGTPERAKLRGSRDEPTCM